MDFLRDNFKLKFDPHVSGDGEKILTLLFQYYFLLQESLMNAYEQPQDETFASKFRCSDGYHRSLNRIMCRYMNTYVLIIKLVSSNFVLPANEADAQTAQPC